MALASFLFKLSRLKKKQDDDSRKMSCLFRNCFLSHVILYKIYRIVGSFLVGMIKDQVVQIDIKSE